MSIAKTAIDGIWNSISAACQASLDTPARQSRFTVREVKQDGITILTSGETTLYIARQAFEGALRYLLSHGHDAQSMCPIGSNVNYDDAGPLCRAARTAPNGQMNITYVLPVLEKMGLVGIEPRSGKIASATWFIA